MKTEQLEKGGVMGVTSITKGEKQKCKLKKVPGRYAIRWGGKLRKLWGRQGILGTNRKNGSLLLVLWKVESI